MSTIIQNQTTEPTLQQKANEIFDRTSPYDGFGFKNHCIRLFTFATMLMKKNNVSMDHGVAYLIAFLHDLGLVTEIDQGEHYLARSLALFERETKSLDLKGTNPELIRECLLYNHRALPVSGLRTEAECFRQAVQIEHGRGLITYGLPRDEVREIYRQYPRGNFSWVLVDFAKRVLSKEPMTVVNGIFF